MKTAQQDFNYARKWLYFSLNSFWFGTAAYLCWVAFTIVYQATAV